MGTHAVVVVNTKPASPAEQAGMQRGDRLLSYNGHVLTSPQALLALEENTLSRKPLLICGERNGSPIEFALPSGKAGLASRPELPEFAMAEYERGWEAFTALQYEEAYQAWSETASRVPDSTTAAWLYSRAGEAAISTSRWQQGIAFLTKAEELLAKSPDTVDKVQVWGKLGWCNEALNDLDAAESWYEKARQENEAAGRRLWAGGLLNALGNVARIRGDLETAYDYYHQWMEICDIFAPGSMNFGVALNNLGDTAVDRGDLDAAADYHTRALEIWERLAPDSHFHTAGLNGLGNIALARGQIARARGYLTRSYEICRQIAPRSAELARSLNNLGLVCEREGDLLSARDHIRDAVKIWEEILPGSQSLAVGLDNLGQMSLVLGDTAAAEKYHRSALVICERNAPDSLESATILNGLGDVALGRDCFPEARSCFQRSLEIRERHAPGSVSVAASFSSLARLCYGNGEVAAAEAYYAKALLLWEQLAPDSLDCANARDGLGRIALKQNRISEALGQFSAAVEIIERHRSLITAPEARALLLAQHLRKYAGLLQSYAALGDIGNAFHTLERARARAFTELLAARVLDKAPESVPPEMLQEQQKIDDQRRQSYDTLNQLTSETKTCEQVTHQVDALHQALRELERQQQDLSARIRAASPHDAALRSPQPLPLASAQTALEPGTLLLSYFVDEEQTFLFAVTATCAEMHCLPVGREALQEQVKAFRQALNRERLMHDPAQETLLGRRLFAALLRPAVAAVGRADRLLLCPDSSLHALPFAALVTNLRGSPKYLGAQKPLSHILSVTTYAQVQAGRSPSAAVAPRLLAFGDPVYYAPSPSVLPGVREQNREALSQLQTRGLSLVPLPHSRVEVESLAELYGSAAQVRLGPEATKTAVLRESGNADILHFACHAWFDPKFPLSSGLALSQPETSGEKAPEEDNGLLQAWEIMQTLTLSANLVVLSACQSGAGQEVRGEGLVGLTRAFQYAGAKSLVVSLWDVNDAGTALFMQAFYGALKKGIGKDEALQQGAQALQANPRWNAPCHWAAFVLIGERR